MRPIGPQPTLDSSRLSFVQACLGRITNYPKEPDVHADVWPSAWLPNLARIFGRFSVHSLTLFDAVCGKRRHGRNLCAASTPQRRQIVRCHDFLADGGPQNGAFQCGVWMQAMGVHGSTLGVAAELRVIERVKPQSRRLSRLSSQNISMPSLTGRRHTRQDA